MTQYYIILHITIRIYRRLVEANIFEVFLHTALLLQVITRNLVVVLYQYENNDAF